MHNTTTRRKAIISGIGALIGVAGASAARAQTPEFRIKFGTDAPESFPLVIYARQAAQQIAKETGGRMQIEIFPASQLGTSTDMLSQVRSGALEMIGLQGATLSTLVPVAAINAVGFAFSDYPTVWRAMDGDLGNLVRKSFAPSGLQMPMRMWDSGFRLVFNKVRPVATPDDLKAMKIRVPVSPLWLSMFKGLGTSPVSINVGELYSALQTGIADGCELPISGFDSLKAYEVQKYCAVTNHIWDGYWPVFNARTWSRIPAPMQEIVVKAFDAAGVEQRKYNEQLSTDLVAQLQKKGVVFNRPPQEPFRQMLAKAGFYEEWRQKFGPEAWATLERYTGKLS